MGWRRGVYRTCGRSHELPSDNAVGRDGPDSRMATVRQRGGRLSMATSVIRRGGDSLKPKRGEGGFSLLRVVISMAGLTAGLGGLLGGFGTATASAPASQQDIIAQQQPKEE